jgi:hypothetical protein
VAVMMPITDPIAIMRLASSPNFSFILIRFLPDGSNAIFYVTEKAKNPNQKRWKFA